MHNSHDDSAEKITPGCLRSTWPLLVMAFGFGGFATMAMVGVVTALFTKPKPLSDSGFTVDFVGTLIVKQMALLLNCAKD